MIKEKESTKESVGFHGIPRSWGLVLAIRAVATSIWEYVERGLRVALRQFFLYPDEIILFKVFIASDS